MSKTKKQRSLEKTLRKLERKRVVILNWLIARGETEKSVSVLSFEDVLKLAYEKLGMDWQDKAHYSAPALHSYYNVVLTALGKEGEPRRIARREHQAAKSVRPQSIREFYDSYQWRKARYDVLQKNDGKCELCGRRS